MQTTLLGFAILVIVALVTALVGPFFVDWGQYRTVFEARASQIAGVPVRIAGAIEVRLLPAPSLTLTQIEIGRREAAGTLAVRKLGVEFALGALIRGEFRAADMRLEGAVVALGLGGDGRLDWPLPAIGFDPSVVSIQRLVVDNSHVTLVHAESGSQLVLDKLEFEGELRSLAGPVRGDGSFVIRSQHYPFMVAASRPDESGGVKVRLKIDPIPRAGGARTAAVGTTISRMALAEGTVWMERGLPRFDGNLTLDRLVERANDGSVFQPWRITSHVKGDSAALLLDQLEFQYGPDERAIKLRGSANFAFGREPQITGVLASPQIDLDLLLAMSEATPLRPLASLKALAGYIDGMQRLPVPIKFGISAESVTLAGAMLQRLTGDVKIDGGGWDIESLDLRAPGFTQVRLSGRLGVAEQGFSFKGPVKVDARDARALLGWLTDKVEAQAVAMAPLRLDADEVELSSGIVAVTGLKAQLDRMAIEGRLKYSWANGNHPARLDAAIIAPDIDLDRAQVVAQALFGDTDFEWPREGALAVKVGRAAIAGIDARDADIKMRLDSDGLEVEHFTLGDFGGAAVTAQGRIAFGGQAPWGALALDLGLRKVDGVAALLEKLAPQAAEQVRRNGAKFLPANLAASFALDPAASSGALPFAKLSIEGTAGAFTVNLRGDAGLGDAATLTDLPKKLGAGKLGMAGRIEAQDGGALIEVLGLDRFVAVDRGHGRFNVGAGGSIDGGLGFGGQLVAGGLNISGSGNLRLNGSQGPTADLRLNVVNANLRTPQPVAAGRAGETLPAALKASLRYADGGIALTDLSGKVAGAGVSGKLDVVLGQPVHINGNIDVAAINLPAALAAAIGMPAASATVTTAWPAEPFEPGLLGTLAGTITVQAAHVTLTQNLAVLGARGVVSFDQGGLALRELAGTLAGGMIAGDLAVERSPDGLAARSQVRLAGADIAQMIPGEGRPPLAGRLTLEASVKGSGRSPAALINAFIGGGNFVLQDGAIARLDPATFDAIVRAVDQGLPSDAERVRDRVEQALARNGLPVALAQGTINIAAGQARLIDTTVQAAGAELALSASMTLAENAIDARLTLSGPRPAGPTLAAASGAGRPEIQISLRGPLDAPRRTLDVGTLATWLTLRSVEQRTKQVDALESVPVDPGESSRSTAPSVYAPAATTATPAQPAVTPETPVRPRPGATPAPAAGETRPPARGAGIPAAPPTIEGVPPSLPRQNTPARSDTTPRPSPTPKANPPPGLPRSLLPRLFGGP